MQSEKNELVKWRCGFLAVEGRFQLGWILHWILTRFDFVYFEIFGHQLALRSMGRWAMQQQQLHIRSSKNLGVIELMMLVVCDDPSTVTLCFTTRILPLFSLLQVHNFNIYITFRSCSNYYINSWYT